MSKQHDHNGISKELDQIAQRAAGQLERASSRDALRKSVGPALLLVVVAPTLAVLIQLLRIVVGAGGDGRLVWWVAPLFAALPLAYLAWRFCTGRNAANRQGALLSVDRKLSTGDRFRTADDFLKRDARDGFMLAAIDDATGYVGRGKEADVTPLPAVVRVSRREKWAVPTGVVLLVCAVLLAAVAPVLADGKGKGNGDASSEIASITVEQEGDTPASPFAGQQDLLAMRANAQPPQQQKKQRATTGKASSNMQTEPSESKGAVGEGKTAESEQASSPSNARGAPSGQAQESKSNPNKPKKKKKKKKKKQGDIDKKQKKRPEEKKGDPAGATAGQGSSKGSNKNPATSDWASKDQISTPDDSQVDEHDDVEDEEEEQESRGGVQPSLRDRRAPVNRDLGIGFGSKPPSPDANGRGGPSTAKKSRGVASFVLGVPITDRVKGQPNPGKTKVTQQRVQPESEPLTTVNAQGDAVRDGEVGPVHHPVMQPWLRQLVREYFLERRREAVAKKVAGSNASNATGGK